MTNNELRRWMNGVRDDLKSRLDRHEGKLDDIQQNCVGCAREFGQLTEQVKAHGEAIDEHKKNHRDNVGLAAVIGGVIVAAIQFVWNAIRGGG